MIHVNYTKNETRVEAIVFKCNLVIIWKRD